MQNITTVNPANGAPIHEYEQTSDGGIEAAIQNANAASSEWRSTDFPSRAALLKRTAVLLKEKKKDLAARMTEEMGKPFGQGMSEAEKCAWACEYAAEHGAGFLQPEPVDTEFTRSYVSFQPLGAILAIMPWNFPFWQLFRFGASALMAGNTIVLKHAPGTLGCGIDIEKLFKDAGFPAGVMQTVIVDNDRAPDLIRHPLIRAVTLTGSTGAGRAVAAAAGTELKKCVLELGGSDPYLILDDADINHAASACVTSRLINSGQSCIAAKRFIAMESVHDDFVDAVIAEMEARSVGDPLEEATDIGPLAREDLRDNLHRQVTESIKDGAICRTGGTLPKSPGFYYPPTVLTGVEPGMSAFDEELFGPVAAVVRARDEEHAIDLANRTVYGLGAGVFTRDAARGEAIARDRLLAGSVAVNDFVKSDPRLPFGGILDSGYGRELGKQGIREFINVKTIVVK